MHRTGTSSIQKRNWVSIPARGARCITDRIDALLKSTFQSPQGARDASERVKGDLLFKAFGFNPRKGREMHPRDQTE